MKKTEGKPGRRPQSYRLARSLRLILDDIEREKKEEAKKDLVLIKKMQKVRLAGGGSEVFQVEVEEPRGFLEQDRAFLLPQVREPAAISWFGFGKVADLYELNGGESRPSDPDDPRDPLVLSQIDVEEPSVLLLLWV